MRTNANLERTNANSKEAKGFTLIEVLISVSIVALIATTLIIATNPNEIFKQARDSRRMADLTALSTAISLYVNSGSSINMDGQGGITCKGGSNQKVYVSIPNNQTPPQNLPLGWSYGQVTSTNLKKIDGTGWIPINFATLVGGSPISSLPVDPINSFTKNLFYSYTCKSNGAFELTATLESKKYNMNGSDPKTSTDGGTDRFLFEIGTDLTLDPFSPVLELSFDEGQGTIAYDSSGNNNNGTLCNGSSCNVQGPQWVDGKVGKALSFDGVDDYLDAGNGTSLNIPNKWTLSVWLKRGDTQNYRAIISKYNDIFSQPYYALHTTPNTLRWEVSDVGSNIRSLDWYPSHTLSISEYYYIVLTYDGNNFRLYQNGIFMDSRSWSYGFGNNTFPLRIGKFWAGNFNGFIDEVRIYNRTLSDSEIKALYEATK
jgi:prepilin-type N-terminal cleavage/methylation domain-containing protein